MMVAGEVHHGQAVEEKISLSGGLSLWIAFHPFNQDPYVEVCRGSEEAGNVSLVESRGQVWIAVIRIAPGERRRTRNEYSRSVRSPIHPRVGQSEVAGGLTIIG